jgi:hypothetical protein
MYNKELFEYISKGNIEKSLYNTCIFLIENSKIEILEETLIFTCSYIGSFINIYNIAKFNDIINITLNIINSNNIDVVEYLTLITKMCILCDIQIKNPSIKTGTIPINQLRHKILNVFNCDINLNKSGRIKFDSIIPPSNSDIYDLTIKIITSFLQIFKIIETTDSFNDITHISILFRDSFDYIIRKKYVIQTKFCLNDNDPVFFLWGFVNCIYADTYINNYYKLFIFNNVSNKTLKKQRTGLIFGAAVSIIYNYKKHLIYSWNNTELEIINKINHMSLHLFKEVKKEIIVETDDIPNSSNEEEREKKNKIDGLNYINEFIPKVSLCPRSYDNYEYQEEYKIIDN